MTARRSAIGPSGSNAPVFTLPDWAHTIVGPSTSRASPRALRAHPPLVVRRDTDDRRRAEPDQSAGRPDRRVRFRAGDDRHARRPLEAERLDVPSDAAQHLVPCRRQRRHVRHRRTRDEADAGGARKIEQVEHPPGGDLLDRRHRGRQDVQAGVLIPRRREPVGGDRRRKAAAGHEAEVSRAGARDQAGLSGRGELLDDRDGICGPSGIGPPSAATSSGTCRARVDRRVSMVSRKADAISRVRDKESYMRGTVSLPQTYRRAGVSRRRARGHVVEPRDGHRRGVCRLPRPGGCRDCWRSTSCWDCCSRPDTTRCASGRASHQAISLSQLDRIHRVCRGAAAPAGAAVVPEPRFRLARPRPANLVAGPAGLEHPWRGRGADRRRRGRDVVLPRRPRAPSVEGRPLR